MNIIEIVIGGGLYVLLISVGIFIIIQNPVRKSFRNIGITLLLGAAYILTDIMSMQNSPLVYIVFWSRLRFIVAEFCILFCFYIAYEFAIEEDLRFLTKRWINYTITIFAITILILLSSTNLIVNYSLPTSNPDNYMGVQFFINKLYFFRVLSNLLRLLYISLTFFIAFRKNIGNKNRRLFGVLFLGSFFLFIGANFGLIQYYLIITSTSSIVKFPLFIQNALLLVVVIIVTYIILSKKMIEGFFESVKEFLSSIGYSLLWASIYLFVWFITYYFFTNKSYGLLFAFILFGLVIISHSTSEWFVEIFKNFVKTKQLSTPPFFTSDLSDALKFYNCPNLLENNKLLKLDKVIQLSKEKKIDNIKALKLLLEQSIDYFSPKETFIKRSAPRLRYEILRMLAFEGATESQIMWDLGFDVYTKSRESKISEFHEPRFKVSKSNEYSATSDRSFKRLRKEAIEMLKWKLIKDDL